MSALTPHSYGLHIGGELSDGAKAVYDQNGGDFISYYNTYVGYQTGSATGALAQWNIRNDASVKSNWSYIYIDSFIIHEGDLVIGQLAPGYTPGSASELARSEVNIFGGTIDLAGGVSGDHTNGFLNIYGSEANIKIGKIVDATRGLDINFMLDHYGASTIHAAEAHYMGGPDAKVDVTIPGFISLKVDHVDLFSTQKDMNYGTDFMGENNLTPFDFTPNYFFDTANSKFIFRLEMADMHPTWNLIGVHYVDGNDPNSDGLVKGALYVEGESKSLQAIFTGLAGETRPEGSLAFLLMNYLNDSMVETGVYFSLLNDTSLLLTGDYLNDLGYAWFGWDLTGFNVLYDSNVLLKQFNEVPEPATWAILLLGGATLVVLRRRRFA